MKAKSTNWRKAIIETAESICHSRGCEGGLVEAVAEMAKLLDGARAATITLQREREDLELKLTIVRGLAISDKKDLRAEIAAGDELLAKQRDCLIKLRLMVSDAGHFANAIAYAAMKSGRRHDLWGTQYCVLVDENWHGLVRWASALRKAVAAEAIDAVTGVKKSDLVDDALDALPYARGPRDSARPIR